MLPLVAVIFESSFMFKLFILTSPLVRPKFILFVKESIERFPLVALPVKLFIWFISISPLVDDTSRVSPSYKKMFPLVDFRFPVSNVVTLISPLVVSILPLVIKTLDLTEPELDL